MKKFVTISVVVLCALLGQVAARLLGQALQDKHRSMSCSRTEGLLTVRAIPGTQQMWVSVAIALLLSEDYKLPMRKE